MLGRSLLVSALFAVVSFGCGDTECVVLDGGCSEGCLGFDGLEINRADMCLEPGHVIFACVPNGDYTQQGITVCYVGPDGREFSSPLTGALRGGECEAAPDSWPICE